MSTATLTQTAPSQVSRRTMDMAPEKSGYEIDLENLEYVYHGSFSSKYAERKLWGDDQFEINVPRYHLLPQVPEDAPRSSLKAASLSADEEKTLFLRYNYAKWRLGKLMKRRKLTPAACRRVGKKWVRRAQLAREKIVHANLPLVPSMANRVNVYGVEFGEMIAEGYMAVLRSVEKFDVSRGFKFSTYACRSILSSFHRLTAKNRTFRKHFPTYFEPQMEQSDFVERRHCEQREDAIDAVRKILRRNAAGLSKIERKVVVERFAIASSTRPRTLSEVGKVVGLSNERVRQIEQQGLGKIRAALEDQYLN